MSSTHWRRQSGAGYDGPEVVRLPGDLAVAQLEDCDHVVVGAVGISAAGLDDPMIALAGDAPEIDLRRSPRVVARDVEAGLLAAYALPGLGPFLDEVLVHECRVGGLVAREETLVVLLDELRDGAIRDHGINPPADSAKTSPATLPTGSDHGKRQTHGGPTPSPVRPHRHLPLPLLGGCHRWLPPRTHRRMALTTWGPTVIGPLRPG